MFGKAVSQDLIKEATFAKHEPSLKNSSGEIVPPESGGLICLEQLMGAEIWKQAPSNVSLALDQEGKNMYGMY